MCIYIYMVYGRYLRPSKNKNHENSENRLRPSRAGLRRPAGSRASRAAPAAGASCSAMAGPRPTTGALRGATVQWVGAHFLYEILGKNMGKPMFIWEILGVMFIYSMEDILGNIGNRC